MRSKLYKKRLWTKGLMHVIGYFSLFIGGVTVASAAEPESLGTVAANIVGNFHNLTLLITAISYLAGLGFAIGAVMKFKQHKDNPTQIPIGTPIALVFIAAALLFFPSMLQMTGVTMFGSPGQVAGPSGTIFS